MRIPCPFCGERDVREFSYLGDATLDAARRHASRGRGHARLRLSARQPGRARIASSGITAPAAAAWLVVTRDTRTHAIDSARVAPTRGGRPHDRHRRGAALPARPRGRPDRPAPPLALPLRRHAPLGLRRRHAGLGAARQRREARRPLVQVSPAARHPARRAPRSRTRSSSCARARAASRTPARPTAELYRRAGGAKPEPLALAAPSTCWR